MDNQPVAAGGSITAVLQPDLDVYDDGFLCIKHNSYYVSCNGTSLVFPRKEFLILSRLARKVGRIVPMQVLWADVWGEGEPFNAVTLRVHVCHLRQRLSPFGVKIKSLVAVGYGLCVFTND